MGTQMSESGVFMTISDGAALIERSTRTVRRWITNGEVPLYRGKLVKLDDLEWVLDENLRRMTRRPDDDWERRTIRQGDATVAFAVSKLLEALAEQAPDADWSTLKITGAPGGKFEAAVRPERP